MWHKYVSVNGTRLYCEGAGSGEPVVLVHGGGGDRRYWDGQFNALARSFRVIRYDLRGYGRSATPEEGRPYRHEDDLAALLDALELADAHIAGYSLGCQITIDAYTLYPERFRSIMAVGPYVSGHSSPAADRLFSAYLACGDVYNTSGAHAAAHSFASIPAFLPEKISESASAQLVSICSDYTWWWAHNTDPLEPVSPPGASNLHAIAVPMLILSAEFDAEVCREVASLLGLHVADTRRVDVSGATHFMLMERPEEVAEVMGQFLLDLA